MKSAILIGKTGITDIKFKRIQIQKINSNNEIITSYKQTEIPMEGHQGGEHLTGRILRPSELISIQKVISEQDKDDELTNFNCQLLTGGRYKENQWIQKHPECFEGSFITLKNTKPKAIEASGAQRNIKLSNMGKLEMRHFFKTKYLPTVQAYNEKLKRWAHLAGIDEAHISVRMLRKSWESWLFACYPELTAMIVKSQGHTSTTALKHYIDIRFEDEDIQQMRQFIEGWKPENKGW